MLDIGWSELLIIGVVALVVVGPKELPQLLRVVGQFLGKMRRMAAEFQGQVNEAIREAELEDVKKSVEDLKSYNPATMLKSEIEQAMSPVTRIGDDVRSELAGVEAGLTSDPSVRPAGSVAVPNVEMPSIDAAALPTIDPEPPVPDFTGSGPANTGSAHTGPAYTGIVPPSPSMPEPVTAPTDEDERPSSKSA